MSINTVVLSGNLVRDPQIHDTNGKKIASFTIAVNRKYTDKNGEKKEEVSFVKVVSYGGGASICQDRLSKGSLVVVEGRIKQERWEKDGKKNERTAVYASQIIPVPSRAKEEGTATPQEPEAPETNEVPIMGDDDIPF